MCVWCKRPISLIELEIDHLIYKTIEFSKLSELIEHFALRADFDVDETYNLAPSCRRCNGSKSNRLPQRAPAFMLLFQEASTRAPSVESKAEANKKLLSADLNKVFAIVDHFRDDVDVFKKLEAYVLQGASLEPVEEPSLRFLLTPQLEIALDSAGNVHAFSFGDCPSGTCPSGHIGWQQWPQENGDELAAGACDVCGLWAVACPEPFCGSKTTFVWDEQPCDSGDKVFRLVRHKDEVEDVVML